MLLATVASLALGCHDLTTRPISQDEASSFTWALAPRFTGLDALGGDFLFYFLVLRVVVEAFGTSLVAERLLSVLAGAATVPVVHLIGRRLAGRRVGVMAAVLVSVSLPLVFWQQNARAYALGTLLVCVSMLAFVAMLDSPASLPAYLWFAASVLALYTVMLSALVVLAQAVTVVVVRRQVPGLRRVVLAGGALLVAAVPLLLLALHTGGSPIAWVPRPGFGSLRTTATALMAAGAADGPASSSPVVAPLAWASGAACVASVVGTLLSRRPEAAGARRRGLLLCGAWLVLPPVAAFAFSQVSTTHIYVDRYFLPSVPAAALLLALGLDLLRPAPVAAVAAAVLTGARLAVIPSTYGVPLDFSSEAAYLLSAARPGDCITFAPPQSATTAGVAADFAWWAAHDPGSHPLPRIVLPSTSWSDAARATYSQPADRQTFAEVRSTCRRLWVAAQPQLGSSIQWQIPEIDWFLRHGWKVVEDRAERPMRLVAVGAPPAAQSAASDSADSSSVCSPSCGGGNR